MDNKTENSQNDEVQKPLKSQESWWHEIFGEIEAVDIKKKLREEELKDIW